MAILYVNGAAMPAPSGMLVTLEDIGDDAGRNVLGEKVVDRVAVKRTLEIAWARLTSAQLARLMAVVTEGIFFTARYPDPMTDDVREAVFTAVDRQARVYRADGALPEWAEVSMKWEER